MSRFDAYDLALQAALALRPLLDPINRRDPDLCRQMRRAASSVAMCLDEGSQRTGRDRFHLYRVAAGSAAEVRTASTRPGVTSPRPRPPPPTRCLTASSPSYGA